MRNMRQMPDCSTTELHNVQFTASVTYAKPLGILNGTSVNI